MSDHLLQRMENRSRCRHKPPLEEASSAGYRTRVPQEFKCLHDEKDGQRVIGLDAMHRCPFLDDAKLCRLVSAYGDSVLSETCATFPREYHTFHNHKEGMLMPCCPAVIDLWRDTLLDFPQVSDPDALFLIRASIMDLIQDTNISIEEALLESFYILSELAKTLRLP